MDDGIPMFDKEPVIIKPWSADLDVKNIDISSVLIWVRIMKFDLKHWGQHTLMKLGSILGKPLKTDRATAMKELLQYTRLLIEVPINVGLPDSINFENEWGGIQCYDVHYEWSPVKCKHCGMYGHQEDVCKKSQGQQVWQEKGQNNGTKEQPMVTRRAGKEPMVQLTEVANGFDALQAENLSLVFGSIDTGDISVLMPIDEGRGDDNMEDQGDAGGGPPPNLP